MKKVKRFLNNVLSFPLAVLVLLLALMPFGVLYFFSHILYFLLWHIVGYRKNVVLCNLQKAFPEWDDRKRKDVARKFFHHLSELIMESVGLMTVPVSTMRKRVHLDEEGRMLMARYYQEGRSAIMTLGHYGNWEWMGAGINLEHPGQLIAGYRHLRNRVFDRLIYRTRMRFYKQLIPSKKLARKMVSMAASKEPAVFALLADQWPRPDTAFWVDFLGRETPFFTGPEKLARKLGHPVLFCSIRKQKRGHYLINVQVITEDPKSLAPQEITQRYATLLEEEIRQAPQYWLWSHRRWKKEKQEVRNEK
ncbi:MAG: lysophospholipid acyltransferase family protein [Bacteroides sp.]|jgi:KDO2-lipid IV(A) lauroyltransferase|nr:lysophospholipid acyltransferase family protein [Bacteroides sp.]